MQLWSLWILMITRPAEAIGQWLIALSHGRIITVKQTKFAASTLLHLLLWAIALACTIAHLPDRLWVYQADSGPPKIIAAQNHLSA